MFYFKDGKHPLGELKQLSKGSFCIKDLSIWLSPTICPQTRVKCAKGLEQRGDLCSA
jgi:hypothetical protein